MAENRELALVLKLVADQFQRELKNSQGALGQFNSFIKDWKTQLTAAGAALFAIAKSTANYGDELVKASQRMGTTVEDTARLQYAAKLSDTDLQGLTKTVGFLSKEMFAASTGNAESQRTFERLGISVVNASGQLKGTTQVLLEMNDKFRLMPEGPEKTALAMLSLGKSGKDVLPLLNSNMREAFTEAEQLGLVMSEKDARAAEHFNDEMTKLGSAIRGVTNDIGTALIPKFDVITHALRTIIEDAHSAAGALSGLGKSDSGVGVVKPSEGGRNLRILPAPPGVDKAVVPPFFQTEAQAKDQEAIGRRLTEQFIGQFRVQQQMGREQEALGLAKLNIFLAQNRAIDIGFDAEARRNAESRQAMEETAAAQKRIDDISGAKQEALGRGLVSYELARRQMAKQELSDLSSNAKAWLDYAQEVGGSQELIYTHQLDLVRANLAQQLDLNLDTAGRLVIAWQNKDEELARSILDRTTLTATQRETIELQTIAKIAEANNRASSDFFAGWADGLRRYATNQSLFGMAADMSRRFFKTAEHGVQKFLFDAAEGRLQRLRDIGKSILTIINQLVAQMGAQLMVRSFVGAFAGMGFGFGGGAESALTQSFAASGTGFATGGRFVVPGSGGTDSVPVGFWATPGETVDVRTPGQQGGGSPINIAITVNAGNGMQQTASGDGANFSKLARDLSRLVEAKLIEEQRPGGLLAGGMA